MRKEPGCQRLLYDRYRGFACKIVFRYIYRYEKANDVVTDGFVKAFNAFASFKLEDTLNTEQQLMGWLKRIMINCAIDELRKTPMLPEIGALNEDVWDVKDEHGNADQQVLYKELVSVIKKLPPHYRTVFNLYVVDGYQHAQIADMLQIPISTSRANLSRARTMLQQLVKKMEEGKLCRI